MWENPIFKKVWEVEKKSAVLMKKHYKNGLMLGVLLLAMFFLGRSIGAIAYGLRMQREIKTQETAGTALENTEALFSAENWGLGFGAEGTQPTGTEMAMYYRPPQGKYSETNLQMAKDLGYATFFWSLAYVDWNVDAQPSHEEAFSKLTGRIHPGAVVLLHNTSKTNGEILDELLTKWEEMGYTFGKLEELVP